MKKFLLPILMMFGVLIFCFPSSSLAYTGGLLDHKVIYFGSNIGVKNSSSNLATDDDLNTSAFISGSSRPTANVGWYHFSTPQRINGYILKSNSNGLDMRFYDSNKQVIYTINASNLDFNYNVVNFPVINNVSYFSLTNKASSNTVIEVDLFGVSPAKHDELSSLTTTPLDNSVGLFWDIPLNNPDFMGTKIYRNGQYLLTVGKNINFYNDVGLQNSTDYTYKLTAFFSDNFETNGLSTLVTTTSGNLPLDTTPPGEVSGINNVPFKDQIDFTFTLPSDPDFDHVNVYKNNVLVGQAKYGSYSVTGLQALTNYDFKFSTVDKTGNESKGIPISVQTLSNIDITPPNAPNGVKVSNMSNGAVISWSPNSEPDLDGYYVYVNGQKDNSAPIRSTHYSLKGLTVGSSYDIQISAVDVSGNESVLSAVVQAIPNPKALPFLKMGFDLSDIVSGVQNWFGALWLIVAFAAAIPLAFYISNRLKLLFLQ